MDFWFKNSIDGFRAVMYSCDGIDHMMNGLVFYVVWEAKSFIYKIFEKENDS